MLCIETIAQMRAWTSQTRANGESIGFVPTMGCLHGGHAHLLRQARRNNDRLVLSVFANPLQFRRGAYEAYPRRLDEDLRLAEAGGVDVVFVPAVDVMYPHISGLDELFGLQSGSSGPRDPESFTIDDVGIDKSMSYIRVPDRLVMKMDGKDHPWHFDGVATVVKLLFEAVGPDRAYFGKKDIQQLAILESMNAWLTTGIQIVPVPVVREPDGLSSSSRLVMLDDQQRSIAVAVCKCVDRFVQDAQGGDRNTASLISELALQIKSLPTHGNELVIDSIDCVHPSSLQTVERPASPAVIYIAYIINGIRLAESRRCE